VCSGAVQRHKESASSASTVSLGKAREQSMDAILRVR
jgi:hypothetical protein